MFHSNLSNRISHFFSKNAYVLFFILVVSIIVFSHAQYTKASPPGDVTGWLWSSNTGWVSMNCSNTSSCAGISYGVTQSSSGDWTGYGWSSNVGWLKFNTGCPTNYGQCNAKLTASGLSGWARFCQQTSNPTNCSGELNNGWDGWVSLSYTNDNDLSANLLQDGDPGIAPNNYGPTQDPTSGKLVGFAWGAGVVGWLNFYNVVAPINTANGNLALVPSVTSLPNPIGQTSTITISPAQAESKIYLYYYKTTNTTYTSCTSSVSPATPVVSVMWTGAVTPLPLLSPSFTTKTGISVPDQVVNHTNTYTLDCTTSGGTHDITTATVKISNTVVPTLTLTPSSVIAYPPYFKVDLTWSSSNPDFTGTCTGSGGSSGVNTYDWNSYPAAGKIAPITDAPSQTQTGVYVPSNPTTFTIKCNKTAGGSLSASTTPVSRNMVVTLSGGGMFCPVGSTYPTTPHLDWFAFEDPGMAWCTTPQNIAPAGGPMPTPTLSDFTLTYNQPAESVTSFDPASSGYYAMVCKDNYGNTAISNVELVNFYSTTDTACTTNSCATDGVDNDGDTQIDETGELCSAICATDSLDNDNDGVVDESGEPCSKGKPHVIEK